MTLEERPKTIEATTPELTLAEQFARQLINLMNQDAANCTLFSQLIEKTGSIIRIEHGSIPLIEKTVSDLNDIHSLVCPNAVKTKS